MAWTGRLQPAFDRLQFVFKPSLKTRLVLMSLFVAALPIALVSFMLEHEGQETLTAEKTDKLFALTHILDEELGPGGFDALLADLSSGASDRLAAVRHLNGKLGRITDEVARADPGVGVGYYSRRLDAIISYGPSEQYGGTVGQSIAPGHPGREVLSTGSPKIAYGSMVRGQVLNAMLPIKRDGEVIGYIWANEFTKAVERQKDAIREAVGYGVVAGLLLALVATFFTSRGLTNDVNLIIRSLDRMKKDLRVMVPPMKNELGNIGTAINRMAQDLLDARSLTENVLSSVADGIIAVDLDGNILMFNPAAEDLYTVSGKDVIGRSYQELFEERKGMASVLLDTLKTGRSHIGENLEIAALGADRKITASSSVLRNGEGQRIGAVVVLKDVSERDRLMGQVMRADRLAALGELTAGIAHEIRNPLTSIRGFLQYLSENDTAEEWREYAPLIIRQVDNLNHIIEGLLVFGRPWPPRIARVQLNQLVEEMAFLTKGRSRVRIELDLGDDVPVIDADGEALKQVLLNLFINALQAMSDEDMGVVTVTTRRKDGEVMITVKDNGVGLPEKFMGKVFDPFFSTKPAGTGLGLAMVLRIVDAHQGTIAFESKEGVGTTVTILLPVARMEIEETAS